MQENPYIYEEIEQKGAYLESEFKKSAEKYGVNVRVNRVGSMMSVFFTDNDVTNLKPRQSRTPKNSKYTLTKCLNRVFTLHRHNLSHCSCLTHILKTIWKRQRAAFDKVMEILR